MRHHLSILLEVCGQDQVSDFKQAFKRTFTYYNETQIIQMEVHNFIEKIGTPYLESAVKYIEKLIEEEDE